MSSLCPECMAPVGITGTHMKWCSEFSQEAVDHVIELSPSVHSYMEAVADAAIGRAEDMFRANMRSEGIDDSAFTEHERAFFIAGASAGAMTLFAILVEQDFIDSRKISNTAQKWQSGH